MSGCRFRRLSFSVRPDPGPRTTRARATEHVHGEAHEVVLRGADDALLSNRGARKAGVSRYAREGAVKNRG